MREQWRQMRVMIWSAVRVQVKRLAGMFQGLITWTARVPLGLPALTSGAGRPG
jgi:hypothetical protein